MARRKPAKRTKGKTPAKPVVATNKPQADEGLDDAQYWVCHPVDLDTTPSREQDEEDAMDEMRVISFAEMEQLTPYLVQLTTQKVPHICIYGRRVTVDLQQSVRVTAGKTVLTIPVPSHGDSDGQEVRDPPQGSSEEEREEGREEDREEGVVLSAESSSEADTDEDDS